MSRYYPVLLISLLVAACYHKAPEPIFDMAKVLPQDTMVVVLTELQLAEGAVNIKTRQGKLAAEYARSFSDQVLEKHGISTDVFNESMRYYSFYVEKMDKIYEQVIINLSKLESEVNTPH